MGSPKRSHDVKETTFSMRPPRPTSLIPHPSIGVGTNSLTLRWERSVITNPRQIVNYYSCLTVNSNHVDNPPPSYVCRDATTGPTIISKVVADEGSRTRIKDCESLKLASPDLGVGGRDSNIALPCNHSPKPSPLVIEPGLSKPR